VVNNNSSRNLRGIDLAGSSNNQIKNNIATNNGWDGIHAYSYSSHNALEANRLSNNEFSGIDIDSYSSNNNLTENVIESNNVVGVRIGYSCSSNFVRNNVIRNTYYEEGYGIFLYDYASYNLLENNTITDTSGTAIGFRNRSSNNTVFHNNFIGNTKVNIQDSSNKWDNGYPSGGNYWSSHISNDSYSGAHQNETGSDGIGDLPYVIDGNNTDHYPSIKPYAGPHDIGITSLNLSKTVVGQGYSMNVSLGILNYGEGTETFNLTVAANSTTVLAQTVTLTIRSSTMIVLVWNTTGFDKGNYTITTHTEPVQGETDLLDNTYFVNENVRVLVAGDVTSTEPSIPDGVVNVRDITYIILLFRTGPHYPNWNPNADINNDGIVDIRDITIAILNFYKTETKLDLG
jgi:parallel beta-helix repeat protein